MGLHRNRVEQAKLEVLWAKHALGATPRYRRAIRFADQMLVVLRDFLPAEPRIQHIVRDELVMLAFEHNSEIINVPPEWDHLDRLGIEAVMLKTKIERVDALVKPGDA